MSYLSQIDGGPVRLGPSVFWHFHKVLQEHPDDEAIIAAHQQSNHLEELIGSSNPNETPSRAEESTCLRWTYQQLHNAALNLVAAFHKYNIASGSRIVHLFPNSIEWCIISWASKLGKFTQSALDVGLLTPSRAAELQALLCILKADVLVVSDVNSAVAADKALQTLKLENVPKVKIILSPNTQNSSTNDNFELKDWISFSKFALSAAPVSAETRRSIEEAALHDDMSRVCDIMFTSGTSSGKPKGCPRTVAGSLLFIAVQNWGPRCVGEESKINESPNLHRDQSLNPKSARPCNALAGLNFRIIAPTMQTSMWAAGGILVMASAYPDFRALISAIPRFQIKTILMIPPGIHAISNHPDFANLDQSSLEAVQLGGDTVTQATFEKAAQIFPNAEIIASHGMTEGGGALYPSYLGRSGREVLADVEIGKDRSDAVIRFHAGIASIGKVDTGTCLKIADEQNKPVPRNEVGELHFCNVSMVRSYLNHDKPEDFYIEDYLNENGFASHRQWFKSGDLGIIDEDGWVWILGRKKDVIKRMGVSVVPAALESILNLFLNSETAVIPRLHTNFGQVPIAVVKGQALIDSGKSKADIENRVLELFGKDYALGGVVTLEEIGLKEFPLNATGKILKRELLEPVSTFLEAVPM